MESELGAGVVGVVEVEGRERLSHVARRVIDVGVAGAGGVMGLEHSAIVLLREGGESVRRVVRPTVGLK
jgi:hypothetical protein